MKYIILFNDGATPKQTFFYGDKLLTNEEVIKISIKKRLLFDEKDVVKIINPQDNIDYVRIARECLSNLKEGDVPLTYHIKMTLLNDLYHQKVGVHNFLSERDLLSYCSGEVVYIPKCYLNHFFTKQNIFLK